MIIILKLHFNKNFVVRCFRDNNVIVYGRKGTGKDLIFNAVIHKRKKKHYSNMTYTNYNVKKGIFEEIKKTKKYQTQIINISDVSVDPNTFEDLIYNKLFKIEKYFDEGCDIYLSDCGIYLPSQYDSLLDKKFKSFPIYYALCRQLDDNRVHCNTQSLNRVWLKIREQGDHYIHCIQSFKFLLWVFTRVVYYEKYKTALDEIMPMPKGILNKDLRARYYEYIALHGLIKPMWICQFRRSINYDTRYFKRLFY
jgi:hypothetical protein